MFVKIPDTVDKFQEIKYNNPEEYEQIRWEAAVRREENDFRIRLQNGKINTNVRTVKQQEHIQGTKKWKERVAREIKLKDSAPDMFYGHIDIQELVSRYAGTGRMRLLIVHAHPVKEENNVTKTKISTKTLKNV
ncbi:MAG: hypothetical protein ACI4EF_06090 [Coprococcus sp.]